MNDLLYAVLATGHNPELHRLQSIIFLGADFDTALEAARKFEPWEHQHDPMIYLLGVKAGKTYNFEDFYTAGFEEVPKHHTPTDINSEGIIYFRRHFWVTNDYTRITELWFPVANKWGNYHEEKIEILPPKKYRLAESKKAWPNQKADNSVRFF